MLQDNAKCARSIVDASFHNANWSDRIWMYQTQLREELRTLLQQRIIQGRNSNELAQHLCNLFDAGKYNCERLMRTEMTRVQSDAQLQSFLANGFDMYQFNALGNACSECKALDEQHFKIMEAEPGENLPPIHPNCRCAVSAYMDDSAYNEWLDTYQNHGLSFEEWRRRPSETIEQSHVQNLFGRNVYFRTGNMSTDEYVLAKTLWNKYNEIDINPAEKEYVYEELDNNLTAEEKSSAIVHRPIGSYHYTAINKGHNQYKIIDRYLIDEPDNVEDEVMKEMFGDGWRNLL